MLTIFLDIETTGLDPSLHCPIDIAIKIVDISRRIPQATYQAVVKQPRDVWERNDPESLKVNGFTWEDIQLGKQQNVVAEEIVQLFQTHEIQRGKAVFICQNPAFDRGYFNQIVDVATQEKLNWPYHWLDLASMYWTALTQKAFQNGLPIPSELSLSKNDIAAKYQLPPEPNPHNARNGVDHLIACYQKVLGVTFHSGEWNI